MNIVFLGNFSVDYSSESHHAATLESLGHRVIRLQEGQAKTSTIWEHLMEADLFIWVHTHGWSVPEDWMTMDRLIAGLKKMKVPIITYHLDLWFGIERQKDLETDPFYKNLDYFFATDKLMCDWFTENTDVKGVYLPAGVYDKEVYMHDSPAKGNDVIFVGSKRYHPEWSYRPELIDWLRNTYGEKFTHVGGDGDTGTVRGDDLNALYADSKVAVGDTLCINFDYPYYFSDRLFESTGRGGFTIFPYIKGIEDCFEIDKEIVTYEFGNFTQLKEKIDYYLTHDDEREAIRKAGHERTKRDHSYKNRWEAIVKEVTK